MVRRGFVACLIVVLVAAFPSPATAREARRIIVLTVDGTTLGQWLRTPGLAGIVTDGSAALLAARSGADARTDEAVRRGAYATLASGRRTTSLDDARILRDTLAAGRVPLFVSGSLRSYVDGLPAPDLGMLPRPSVAVVAAGDVSEAEAARRGGASVLALGRIAAEAARRALAPGDALILVAPTPTAHRVRERIWLSAAAVLVVGSPRGTLRSATTRRDGVVALVDLAPTILSLAGLSVPGSMDGRTFEPTGRGSSPAGLMRFEEDLLQAARTRRPLTRAWMIAAMVVLGAATVMSRRRDTVMNSALAALPAVPGVLLLLPLLPSLTRVKSVVVVLAAAAIIGRAASTLLPPVRAVAATAGMSAALVLGDLLAGGWLAARSPVSYLIANGVRFYGIGNELMGVVLAGVITACAILLRGATRGNAGIVVPLVAAFSTGVMAAPAAGAKFGAVLVAVPALMVMFVGLAGRRLTVATGALIAAVTAAAAGVIYAADRLAAPAARSHIGRVSSGGIGSVLARKVDAALGIAAFSIWMQALLVCAVVCLVLWRSSRGLPPAQPELGAALKASLVVIVLAPVTNDAGLIASAAVAVVATALLLAPTEEAVAGP